MLHPHHACEANQHWRSDLTVSLGFLSSQAIPDGPCTAAAVLLSVACHSIHSAFGPRRLPGLYVHFALLSMNEDGPHTVLWISV
jgi:hypothetical protein